MLPSLLISYCKWSCLVVCFIIPVIGGDDGSHHLPDEQRLLPSTCQDFLSCAAELSLYNLASLLNYMTAEDNTRKNSQPGNVWNLKKSIHIWKQKFNWIRFLFCIENSYSPAPLRIPLDSPVHSSDLNLPQPADLNQQDDDVVQRLLKKAAQGQELNQPAREDFRHREVRSLPRGPPSNLPLCFTYVVISTFFSHKLVQVLLISSNPLKKKMIIYQVGGQGFSDLIGYGIGLDWNWMYFPNFVIVHQVCI